MDDWSTWENTHQGIGIYTITHNIIDEGDDDDDGGSGSFFDKIRFEDEDGRIVMEDPGGDFLSYELIGG